jgi:hypothetical protein
MNAEIKKELEAIKKNIEAECVSQSELVFLENNKEAVMEYGDIRLAEASGISEEEWNRGYLLTDDEAICSWCGEIYDKTDLQEELNLGLLCDSCIRAIESRGEELNF